MPVITYFLQLILSIYHFNAITALLLLISSIAILWFVRIEQRISMQRLRTQTEG